MSKIPKMILTLTRAAVFGAAISLTGMTLPQIAAAQNITLPSPYVSRALDAVLLPINNDVKNAFNLYPEDTGVFVLSVEPGGVADSYGFMAGDVISFIEGRPVNKPIDLDTYVYFWINQGYYDFIFDVYRGADYFSYTSTITEDLYYQIIDVSSIASWSSYSYESFSYSEWYSEYSSEISESYSSSESYIEETASSEEYYSEVTSEEEMTEEQMTNEELANEAMAEEEGAMTEEEMTNEELANEAAAEDDGAMTEEEMTNEELADEAMAEEAADEDMSAEDSGEDGAVEEDSGEDFGDDGAMEEDTGGDDGGDDSGGDDGGDDSGGDDSGE